MESSSLVKFGLIGGAAYLAYRYLYASSAVSALAPAVTSATPAAPSVPLVPLDAIYTRMVSAAAAEGVQGDGAGLDAWNVYLMRAGVPAPEPAPEDVFGIMPPDVRNQKWTAAQYWAGMAPYLKARGGYAGLGLFGSLCCGGCK